MLVKTRCISRRDAQLRKIFQVEAQLLFRSVHILLVTLTPHAVCETRLFDFLVSLLLSRSCKFYSFQVYPSFSFFSKQFPRPIPSISIFVTKSIIQTRNQVVIRSCRRYSNRSDSLKKKKREKGKKRHVFNVIHARIRAIESIGNNEPTVISG